MLLWLMWASVSIAVYFLLQLETDLWDFILQDSTRITWVIMGLFLIGVAISFQLTMALTNEAAHAIKLGMTVKEKTLHGVDLTHTAGAVERFFYSLKEVVSKNEQPNIEALLDIELAPYERTSHAVEVMGNLLITLGLIGTVVGLTLILAGLSSSLDALGRDQARLVSGLRHAMSGMGTAFYTTLMGAVLGGVLLRVFALITEHGVAGLSDNLKRISMVYILSDTKPTLERELRIINREVDALGNNVKLLQAAMSDSKLAMAAFHDEAQRLNQLGDDADRKQTLRDSVVLQKYYSDLLKEEIRIMNKINRSWWVRLKRSLGK